MMITQRPLVRNVSQRPLADILINFTPRGNGDMPTESDTEFRVDEHQRFPSWPLPKKQKLVDSVLRNFPIHAIIAVRHLVNNNLGVSEFYNIEDGQTRLTALKEYMMDEFPCESGEYCIGNGKKFSELPIELRRHFENYQVTLEIFAGGRNMTQNDIAEIFNRLNNGKTLTDNDKFHSRLKTTPFMKFLTEFLSNSEIAADLNRFIGKVGTGKTRKGLSDMVGACLSIATKTREHGGNACINTSYELNHRYLAIDFSPDEKAEVFRFFKAYFAMLHEVNSRITKKITKKYGKLSGVLGLSVCSWIRIGSIHPAIAYYANKLIQDPKYEPLSFRELSKGDIRNCQGDSVLRRLNKIIEQWEYDRSHSQPQPGSDTTDEISAITDDDEDYEDEDEED